MKMKSNMHFYGYFKHFLLLLTLVFVISSCSSDKEGDFEDPNKEVKDPVAEPILDLSVVNYPDAKVEVDNKNKTIKLSFETPARLTGLDLLFSLDKHAYIVKKPQLFNLLTETTMLLNNNGNEQEYKISATAKSSDFEGWTVSNSFGELPEHIKLYSKTNMAGRDGILYMAVVDMNNPYEFKVLGEKDGVKTPSTFYEEIEGDKPTILINSGYFTWSASRGNYGVSLFVKEGNMLRFNTVSTKRGDNDYFMTRSAVGFEKGGAPEINWVFTDGDYGATHAYGKPSPNVEGETPQAKPTLRFPEGGKIWKLNTAIGAGPIAAKYGKAISFEEMKYELLTGNGDELRPRAAIGFTSDNKMIFFANQGNGFDGFYGYTWEEVGAELVAMGCYDVMHFDGGGSVCMLINGKPLFKSGEVGNNGEIQRAVATVVTVR